MVAHTMLFESIPFSHSGISPQTKLYRILYNMFIDTEKIYIQPTLLSETDLNEAGYHPPIYMAYAACNRDILYDFAKFHGLTKQLEGWEGTNEWAQSLEASVNWLSKHNEVATSEMPQRVYEDYLVLEPLETLYEWEPLTGKRLALKEDWKTIYDYLSPAVVANLSKLYARGCKSYADEDPNARYEKLFPRNKTEEAETKKSFSRTVSGTIILNAFTRFFNDCATRKDISLILQHMNIRSFEQIRLFLKEYIPRG